MRAIHIKPPRKYHSLLESIFVAKIGHVCFLGKKSAFIKRCTLSLTAAIFCCYFFFLLLPTSPSLHQTYVKRPITIDPDSERTWLLDSTVNWDSHQTKLRNPRIVLEKGKVLSQKCKSTNLFQLILFTERRHVRRYTY